MGWSSPPVIESGTVDAEITGPVTIAGGPITVENTPSGALATTRGSALLGTGTATGGATNPTVLTLPVDPTVRGVTFVLLQSAGIPTVTLSLVGDQSGYGYIGQGANLTLGTPQGSSFTMPIAGPIDSSLTFTMKNETAGTTVTVYAVAEYDPLAVVASQALNPQGLNVQTEPFLVATGGPSHDSAAAEITIPSSSGSPATVNLGPPQALILGLSLQLTGPTFTDAGYIGFQDSAGTALWRWHFAAAVASSAVYELFVPYGHQLLGQGQLYCDSTIAGDGRLSAVMRY